MATPNDKLTTPEAKTSNIEHQLTISKIQQLVAGSVHYYTNEAQEAFLNDLAKDWAVLTDEGIKAKYSFLF